MQSLLSLVSSEQFVGSTVCEDLRLCTGTFLSPRAFMWGLYLQTGLVESTAQLD